MCEFARPPHAEFRLLPARDARRTPLSRERPSCVLQCEAHLVSKRAQPVDRFVREHETDVLLAVGDAPSGHGRRTYAPAQQPLRHLRSGQTEIGDAQQHRPAARRHAEREPRQFGGDRVPPSLEFAHVARQIGCGMFERNRRGLLGYADRYHDIGERHDYQIRNQPFRRDDPADPPADHAQLFRRRADRDRTLGHAGQAGGMDDRASIEKQPFHRAVEDQQQIVLHAQARDQLPVGRIEEAARRHRRRHQQHGPRFRTDCCPQCRLVQLPFAARREGERDLLGHTARQADAVQQTGVGRIGDDDFVARLDGGEQRVQNAGESARRHHHLVGREALPRKRRHVGGSARAQPILTDERQIGVGRVSLDGFSGEGERFRSGWEVGIEIFESQKVDVGMVGDRTHAIDADAGNVLQTDRAVVVHRTSGFVTI
ncbi:hypothetical protein BCEP4_290015 [Burkholderia cepacia]|nr:hypothetical protein BCEP4_290015 [Burkholderia cepacia]